MRMKIDLGTIAFIIIFLAFTVFGTFLALFVPIGW
jgi:hypothetical protein